LYSIPKTIAKITEAVRSCMAWYMACLLWICVVWNK